MPNNTTADHLRPVILIPTAEIASSSQEEPPLWCMRSSYASPILANGGTVIFVPQISSIHEIEPLLSFTDGLLLAGGADIDPETYQADASSNLEPIDRTRDRTEILITQWALQKKLPIFGICRGAQIVNVAAGGSLYQHIPSDISLPIEHRTTPITYATLSTHGHLIKITADSRLAKLMPHQEVWVNSMHHQAIHNLGKNLVAVAHSADGVIEAIESTITDHWLIGIQSHPEAMLVREPWIIEIFRSFVAAADAYRRTQPV